MKHAYHSEDGFGAGGGKLFSEWLSISHCSMQSLDAGALRTPFPLLSAQATVGLLMRVEEIGLNSLPGDRNETWSDTEFERTV